MHRTESAHPGLWRLGAATLVLVLAGTLFPYNFIRPENALPGGEVRLIPSLPDLMVNLLLMIPVGYLAAAWWSARTGKLRGALLVAFTTSLLVSAGCELLQIFVPLRDPSAIDTILNSISGALGVVLFERVGNKPWFWAAGMVARGRQIVPASSWLLLASALYAAAAVAISIPLQRAIGLDSWSISFPLAMGNEATGDRPWQGTVYRFEFADKALAPSLARQVSTGNSLPEKNVILRYDFEGPLAALQPSVGPQAPLVWHGNSRSSLSGNGVALSAESWLRTEGALKEVSERVRETNEFTIRLVCESAKLMQRGPARIVSLSSDPYQRNLTLAQSGEWLVVRLRNLLTGSNGLDAQLEVGGVFGRGRRNIVVTYNGSDLLAFVDGRQSPWAFRFSPGAVIEHKFFPLNLSDLETDRTEWIALVILPVALMLAIVAVRRPRGSWQRLAIMGAALCLPLALIEITSLGGRQQLSTPETMVQTLLLACGAALTTFWAGTAFEDQQLPEGDSTKLPVKNLSSTGKISKVTKGA